MKKKICTFLLLIIISSVYSQDAEEFSKRRTELANNLPENSAVILFSKPENDNYLLRYRQSSNFFYLSNYEKPDAMIFITKKQKTLLLKSVYIDRNKEDIQIIKRKTGFKFIRPIEEFIKYLKFFLKDIKIIYTDIPDLDIEDPIPKNLMFFKKLKDKFYNFDLRDISELIDEKRVIHSEAEINLMRKAIEITDNAHIELMKSIEGGMYEYELEAICDYVFKKNGSMHLAFAPIIGAGKNGLEPHYRENNSRIKEDDLIVIDIGAEYDMYCADITRTIPASGKFSERQKTFYNIVLKAQIAAIKSVKPGIDFFHPFKVAQKVIQEELENIGFIEKGDVKTVRKYMKHTISHYLGLDVHDVGDTKSNLRAGMVITIEPGLYIPEYNFGIRIEDDVLVTKEGYEVLSRAPKNIEEIEKIMQEEGIGNVQISDINKYN